MYKTLMSEAWNALRRTAFVLATLFVHPAQAAQQEKYAQSSSPSQNSAKARPPFAAKAAAADRRISTVKQPEKLEAIGSYIEASPSKDHPNIPPNYPLGAEISEKEGWVILSFCVKIDGSVDDLVIDESSRVPQFERAALNAVRQYRYTPAMHDGEPIEQCGLLLRIDFAIHFLPRGARSSFRHAYDKARKALDDKSYGEARSLIEAIRPWNNYEGAYAAVLRMRIAAIDGDEDEVLDELREALRFNKVLEHPMERDLQRLRLSYQLKAQKYSEALAQFDALERNKFQFNAMELSARNRLEAMLQSERPIATPGKLKHQSRLPDDLASWHVGLLRRDFQFDGLVGTFDRFELRCAFKRFVAKVNDTSTWKVPASWGDCSLYVFGNEGATLRIVELAAESASAQSSHSPEAR